MCGIFGITYSNSSDKPDLSKLKETARLLDHRGPDNSGMYVDKGIGFVHTRLSLLDLDSRSNQPFWDVHQRYCIVYNGEIYNFQQLRAELKKQGVTFRTTCDTEVLLYCIIHLGLNDTLAKIEGMFAFAFYDRHENLLYLVRDRFGIKPLFLYERGDTIIFSSEIQAMRPWINFEPDLLSISAYLLGHAGPSKGHSFFKNIKILSNGTITKMKNGSVFEQESFFSVTDLFDIDQAMKLQQVKTEKLVDKAEELLLKSVEQQLIADVPVGALCSGGLDSSLIMAMAQKFHTNLAIFHADVVGKESEFEAAYQLANHLNLDLKSVKVNDEDFISLFPEVIEHYGHPYFINPHALPFLMVSRLIQNNGIKAVLSGEGADECFLGYNFLRPNLKFQWGKPKVSFKNLIKALLHSYGWRNEQKTERKYLMGFSPYSSIAQLRFDLDLDTSDLPELMLGLLNRFEVVKETDEIKSRLSEFSDKLPDYQDYIQSLDLLNYNLHELLHRNDAMGMAASIESRFPFLNTSLVKFAVNISADRKIVLKFPPMNSDGMLFTDKLILRKVAERYLPEEFFQRPKKAFLINAYRRMKISPSLFEKSFVQDLFGLSSIEMQYLNENASHDFKLKLMHLEVWSHIFLQGGTKHEIKERLMHNATVQK